MTGPNRKGIWFALLLACSGWGCRQTEVRPPAAPVSAAVAQPGDGEPPVTPVSTAVDTTPGTPVSYETEIQPPMEPAANAPPAEFIAPESAESRTAVEAAPPMALPAPEPRPLSLDDVLMSVYASFPLLRAELAEREVADGRSIAAWGPYDLNFEMDGIAAPMGFYKNYRSRIGLKQAVYRGGYVYGGYRVGRDDIQPWFKERLTNDAGEFKIGAGVPLLQGRPIDKYRAEVMAADLAVAAVEPGIQTELLQFLLAASDAYWNWVAAGRIYEAQEQLLQLATTRVQQIEERVRSGDLEQIALIDNRRLIASRETKLIEAQRKSQESAIKLSLFFRDTAGQPRVVEPWQVPDAFPPSVPFSADHLPADIEQAWSVRPELRYLDFQIEQVRIELTAAENLLQPRVDAQLEASKDVGARADPKGDKTPFVLEAGIYGEVPLQRRQASGKIQSLQGKLSQVLAKRQYAADKIAAEVQDAVSALEAAAGRIDRASTAVDLARQSLDLGRLGFDSGDLTVITLNLYEQAVLDAELQLIAARADFWKAWAAYQAAQGLNTVPLP